MIDRKIALTNIPKYLPPPPPVLSMETLSWQSARRIWPYLKREIEEQMVNLPLLSTTWFVAENICSFCISLSSYYKDCWAMFWGRAVGTESVLPKIKLRLHDLPLRAQCRRRRSLLLTVCLGRLKWVLPSTHWTTRPVTKPWWQATLN